MSKKYSQDEGDVESGEPTINKGYFIGSICSLYGPSLLFWIILFYNKVPVTQKKEEESWMDYVLTTVPVIVIGIILSVFVM